MPLLKTERENPRHEITGYLPVDDTGGTVLWLVGRARAICDCVPRAGFTYRSIGARPNANHTHIGHHETVTRRPRTVAKDPKTLEGSGSARRFRRARHNGTVRSY